MNDNQLIKSRTLWWALVYVGWASGVITSSLADLLGEWFLAENMPVWPLYAIFGFLGGLAALGVRKALRARHEAVRGASGSQDASSRAQNLTPEVLRNQIALAVVRGSKDFIPLSHRYRITDEIMAVIKFDGTTCDERTTDSE